MSSKQPGGRPARPRRGKQPVGRSGSAQPGAKKPGRFRPERGKAPQKHAARKEAARKEAAQRGEAGQHRNAQRERYQKRQQDRQAGTGPAVDVHVPDGVRLQKVLAQAGLGSRRACEQLIRDGHVTVEGQLISELGVRIDPTRQAVHVDGLRVVLDEHMVYLAVNKPEGVVSSMADPEGRPDLAEIVANYTERIFHVGRLDVESEGLILMTNDGELANRLTHPSYGVTKTYQVQVRGPVARDLGRRLKEGFELDDGPAHVDTFKLIDSIPGYALTEVTIHEGRNRIVRRLFDAAGYPVLRLVRTQFGPIRLGDQRQGTARNLTRVEVGQLMKAVEL